MNKPRHGTNMRKRCNDWCNCTPNCTFFPLVISSKFKHQFQRWYNKMRRECSKVRGSSEEALTQTSCTSRLLLTSYISLNRCIACWSPLPFPTTIEIVFCVIQSAASRFNKPHCDIHVYSAVRGPQQFTDTGRNHLTVRTRRRRDIFARSRKT